MFFQKLVHVCMALSLHIMFCFILVFFGLDIVGGTFLNDDEEEEARRVSLYKCSGKVVPFIVL